MAYLLSNICTKNFWNWTTTIKTIVGGLVEYFWEQCSNGKLVVERNLDPFSRFNTIWRVTDRLTNTNPKHTRHIMMLTKITRR